MMRTVALLVVLSVPLHAQCPDWKPGPFLSNHGTVLELQRLDVGAGPTLFAGGGFSSLGSARADNIARWDGARWVALASGTDGPVAGLAAYDDGTGLALYAGGGFTFADGIPTGPLARWDGATWSTVGQPLWTLPDHVVVVTDIEVHDDGSGSKLYVGGAFFGSGSVPMLNIGRWSAAGWEPVGAGLQDSPRQLQSFGSGGSAQLFASMSTGTSLVRRWTGAAWLDASQGLSMIPSDFAVFDDGSGPALYAPSIAPDVTTTSLVQWTGTTWIPVSPPLPGVIDRLVVHDGGAAPELLALGHRGPVAPLTIQSAFVARWNGASWTEIGSALTRSVDPTAPRVFAAIDFDDGSGPELLIGGAFTEAAGRSVVELARERAGAWEPFEPNESFFGWVDALRPFDSGTGARLYVGGTLTLPGSRESVALARYDGAHLSTVGTGVRGDVIALAEHDDGSGRALYAAGTLLTANGGGPSSRILRWDGSSWSSVGAGSGPNGTVRSLAVFDDGSGAKLYAGGDFTSIGGVPAQHIARWDGTSWSSVGVIPGAASSVSAMCVHDDGGGPALFVGGSFTSVGSVVTGSLARFDGVAWSSLNGVVGGAVRALLSHDDGSGRALYVGGGLLAAPEVPAPTRTLVRWDGLAWSEVPGQPNGFGPGVYALAEHDEGNGPQLFVAGAFERAGSTSAVQIARWDGAAWAALGDGVGVVNVSRVTALASFDDGSGGGADLFVGGVFPFAGRTASANLAIWSRCDDPGTTFCAGDGSSSACPCGNTGASGRGCANSVDARGSLLVARGVASLGADTLVLEASGMPGGTSIFVQGSERDSSGMGTVSFDGVRCVAGTIVRLGNAQNAGGAARSPAPGATPISVLGAIPAGATRHYQVTYRNASASFCPPATANWTNGVAVHWGP